MGWAGATEAGQKTAAPAWNWRAAGWENVKATKRTAPAEEKVRPQFLGADRIKRGWGAPRASRGCPLRLKVSTAAPPAVRRSAGL
eukprot:CAMPEP_0175359928 /NCGR_PEP_ID=MMETSP0095-20121207/15773_1 /TAXON_ID=311494 /ORGANISM="Alexandrium monilatum, Strain CCMP3105" /LENGTH=84 /DNA_ID=CAMNT_0016657717 /DNA_START=169 /DNA_END=421 /DNA_ORIENTATION=+